MSISCKDRPRSEYSSGLRAETLSFLELVVADEQLFSRRRIEHVRAPVRHAHRVVPEQAHHAPAEEDFVADLHRTAARAEALLPHRLGDAHSRSLEGRISPRSALVAPS